MAMTPDVELAITELRDAYPASTVTAVEDGQGGAFVTVDSVYIGERYEPSSTWIKFAITFQYPVADVYPHFIPREVRRLAGPPTDGTPLGTGTAYTQYAVGGETINVIQLSRRSNHLNPAIDTAAMKLEKVLDWLRNLS